MKTKGRRQSKNVIDLTDRLVGPKKTRVKTKEYKIENTRGKLDQAAMGNGIVTDDKPLKKFGRDPMTDFQNFRTNGKRKSGSTSFATSVKNKNLDAKPTKFKKPKKGKK